MNDNQLSPREVFFIKTVGVLGLGAFGLWALGGGLSALRDGESDALFTFVFGLLSGGGALWGAWTLAGHKF